MNYIQSARKQLEYYKLLGEKAMSQLSDEQLFHQSGTESNSIAIIVKHFNRQLAHYPYHVGQIVHIGKTLLNEKWESLSIPKGNSQTYNDKKFAQPKVITHFTNEFTGK